MTQPAAVSTPHGRRVRGSSSPAAAAATAKLDRLRRDRGDDADVTVLAAREKARADAELVRHRGEVEALRGRYLGELVAVLDRGADADFVSLDASLPLVLLPVRIETRFRGRDLLIRVYPDEIAADSHEPELTPDELKLGFAHWRVDSDGTGF